jgi:hypothetical protein
MFHLNINNLSLNEDLYYQLLKMLMKINLSHENSKTIELLLNTIFCKELIVDEVSNDSNNLITVIKSKRIKYSPKFLSKLIESSFNLVKDAQFFHIRSFIYEKVIEILLISKRAM